ncbi:hypothetical protein FXF51_01625 [Nonomuraea sp. PA05]|uniref:hypothetical protein n=1 Tax=Nonomuraea sp. PA05 TaxID=2604466 RepID=UPI0011D3CBAC|nr:hypothetical protein [Nonomuraea sp. PA05]TYB71161.1 hypothetical protein FXF51_01625 [Nonomuraea sp. PA05]
MSLDSHSHHGHLTAENIHGVADRLRATLGDQPFVLVRTSPTFDNGIPHVTVGCTLTSPIEVVTFGDASLGLEFSGGGWSFSFAAGTQFAFEGPVLTISENSPSRHLNHFVFAPEGGGE